MSLLFSPADNPRRAAPRVPLPADGTLRDLLSRRVLPLRPQVPVRAWGRRTSGPAGNSRRSGRLMVSQEPGWRRWGLAAAAAWLASNAPLAGLVYARARSCLPPPPSSVPPSASFAFTCKIVFLCVCLFFCSPLPSTLASCRAGRTSLLRIRRRPAAPSPARAAARTAPAAASCTATFATPRTSLRTPTSLPTPAPSPEGRRPRSR